jgi:hypothetical protein
VTDVRAIDLDEQFVPRQRPSTYTVEIDGDAIVLDEEQNRLHLLNATGALVWACCDGSGTLAEIAADLSAVAAIPPAEVTADVLALARTLGREGLLVGVAADAEYPGVAVPEVQVSGPPR